MKRFFFFFLLVGTVSGSILSIVFVFYKLFITYFDFSIWLLVIFIAFQPQTTLISIQQRINLITPRNIIILKLRSSTIFDRIDIITGITTIINFDFFHIFAHLLHVSNLNNYYNYISDITYKIFYK